MSQKDTLKKSFNEVKKSRVFVALWVVIAVQAVFLIAATFVFGDLGQPGTPVRYDGNFSTTGLLSLDNSTYFINFILFALLVPIINIVLSLKSYDFRGRQMALFVLWMTVIVMLVAIMIVFAILGIGDIY